MEKKMKTVLLLGGFGFLGTNVMKFVDAHMDMRDKFSLPHLSQQYRFIVFDKFAQHPCGVHFDCVGKTYAGDFTDSHLLEHIFSDNTIDMVIHSLSTTIPVSTSSAKYDVETNLLPTLDVLGLMVKYGVKDIVFFSTGGAIYGTRDNKPHIESDAVYPVSSYGVIKLAIEKYIMQYAQLYELRPLIVRISNPYGPYHYSMKQGVINVAIAKAIQKEFIEIWGDGNDKKDYIYVEDFVDILFKLIANNVYNEVINVGSGQLLSVNEIVEYVKQYEPNFESIHKESQQHDASHFELDTTKLHALIGAYSFTDIEQGIFKAYKWVKGL